MNDNADVIKRLIHKLSIALMGLAAMTAPAIAAGNEPSLPLQVSQSIEAPPQAQLRVIPRGAVGVHDVSVGDRSAPLRVRYGDVDLVDANAAGMLLGSDLRHIGGRLRFDRPDTSERAELVLASGDLIIDGILSGSVGHENMAGQDRIWLGVAALEALSGQPVRIAGRARTEPNRPLMTADVYRPPAHKALLTPRISEPKVEAQLVLASYRQSNRVARKAVGRGPLPALDPFDRVFAQSESQIAVSAARSDWKSQESWQIEPEQPAAAPKPRPALQMAAVAEEAPQHTVSKRKQSKPHQVEQHRVEPRLILASASIGGADVRSTAKAVPAESAGLAASSKSPFPQPAPAGLNRVEPAASGAGEIAPADRQVKAEPLLDAELRGTVLIDRNNDGVADAVDQLLEGERVQLIHQKTGRIFEQRSAAFGRFSFVDLAPGAYRMRVMSGWQEQVVEVWLTPGEVLTRNAFVDTGSGARAPPDVAV